ncbi:unnamed protein product [Jaminaea pallidilutea]
MSDVSSIKRQLTIKSGVVKRLTKEEQTYVKEAEEQRQRVQRMEAEVPSADEWQLKQQHKVLQDCMQMIPDCRKRLEAAVDDLQDYVEGLDASLAETTEAEGAKSALEAAKASIQATVSNGA